MQELPRDIQLDIIKRFDMDTRIKCGIVSKLKIPLALVSRLNMVYTFKVHALLHCKELPLCILYRPCCNYISGIGPHSPDVWLDNWYEKEWPLHRNQYMQWYNEGYSRFLPAVRLV